MKSPKQLCSAQCFLSSAETRSCSNHELALLCLSRYSRFAAPVAPSGVDAFTNPLFTHDVYNLVQSDNLRLLLLNQDDRRDYVILLVNKVVLLIELQRRQIPGPDPCDGSVFTPLVPSVSIVQRSFTGGTSPYARIFQREAASVFFFRCTHMVKDDLQLSRFMG